MMSTDELVVNLICLKAGIVPFCGGSAGHIMKSLESLDADRRRKATRKFRKLLKKAIHRSALREGPAGSPIYKRQLNYMRAAAGLDGASSHKEPGTITTSQSNFRAFLVREYLRNDPTFNI